MGISDLPQFALYWHQNDFIGNTGIKKTMSRARFERLTRYLHVSDRENEPGRNEPNYDKLYKIRPVLEMVQQSFARYYKAGQNQTIDEGMIAYKGRLSYIQYLPAKPIKRGIKVWMRCDADTAYLHQFDIYLGKQQNSPNGLGYDVVMKLCRNIFGKNHHIYCDNLFTSIPLVKDLLANKTYCNGTMRANKKYLPDGVKQPGRMVRGGHKSFQDGSSNLVATVWQDNEVVRLVSTNSKPSNILQANRRLGHDVIQVNQPENIQLYNKYMNGVDQHDQMRMKYNVGRFSRKAWKYLLWFLVNAMIVNAYILYSKTSRRQTKKKYAHLDFRLEIAQGLIAGFSSRKRVAEPPLYVGPVALENKFNHDNVHMGYKRPKRCKWHCMQKWVRKETVFGCHLCRVHLCKEGCHNAYHNQN